jgi:hypothetical protein
VIFIAQQMIRRHADWANIDSEAVSGVDGSG